MYAHNVFLHATRLRSVPSVIKDNDRNKKTLSTFIIPYVRLYVSVRTRIRLYASDYAPLFLRVRLCVSGLYASDYTRPAMHVCFYALCLSARSALRVRLCASVSTRVTRVPAILTALGGKRQEDKSDRYHERNAAIRVATG